MAFFCMLMRAVDLVIQNQQLVEDRPIEVDGNKSCDDASSIESLFTEDTKEQLRNLTRVDGKYYISG